MVSSAIKSSSKTLSDIDVTNRAIIEPLALENVQRILDEKYGENVVILNKVVITSADFDISYNDAIANKQKVQLEAEQQAIINQQSIDKAKADAEVAKTTAEGEAEAKLIEAEANAKVNELLEKSLTDNILKDKYIENWDGRMPQVIGSDTNLLYEIE